MDVDVVDVDVDGHARKWDPCCRVGVAAQH